MRLTLIRHAQSVSNAGGLTQPPFNTAFSYPQFCSSQPYGAESDIASLSVPIVWMHRIFFGR
jgi:hypothetical protein